ncbi:MAG TPA: Plug domain-containing protein, partial [Longimicrobium sp.]
FDERRRSWGTGRFFTAEDLQRRLLLETSDLFKNMPGVSSVRSVDGGEALLMRNAFGDPCAPTLYLNGLMMRNLTGSDLDSLVRPQDVAAIEVYAETQVPPQFQDALSGCGSIVVWTK